MGPPLVLRRPSLTNFLLNVPVYTQTSVHKSPCGPSQHPKAADRSKTSSLAECSVRPAATRGAREAPGGRSAANSSVTRSWESVNRYRAAGRPPLRPDAATVPVCGDDLAARQHPLQIRRIDLVIQRGPVDVAERRQSEFLWGQSESNVRIGHLGDQPGLRVSHHRAVVECHRRQRTHRMPPGVRRQLRSGGEGHQAQESRRDHPGVGHPLWIGEDRELLEV